MKEYFVYILASKNNKVIYIGITDDLVGRVWQHKNDVIEGFTKRYQVHKLVYYEIIEDVAEAILREKRMKRWKRQWKNNVINKFNHNWDDVYDQL
jgi:putative endonuclease